MRKTITPASQPIEKILQNVWLKICVMIFDVCFAWKTNEHRLTLTEKSILYRASHYLRIVVISAVKKEKAAFKIQVLIHYQYFLKTSLQIKFTSSEIENSSIQFKKRESASVVFLSRCKNNRKSIAKQFPSFIRGMKVSSYRILLMGIDHFTSHSFAI